MGNLNLRKDQMRLIAESLRDIGAIGAELTKTERIKPLGVTDLALCQVIECVGVPAYLGEADLADYSDYGLTEAGWYVFARVSPKGGGSVTADTVVKGADGAIVAIGAGHVDIAVRFAVAASSVRVEIDWGPYSDFYVFKATDLAVRNLDYRTTFYVYDLAPFVTWEYARATGAYAAENVYFTKDGDEYTEAEVTAGDAIPAYYEQSISYSLTTDTAFQDDVTYYTESEGVYEAATVTAGEAVPESTYYVQVISYALTEDTAFQSGKTYYTLADSVYTAAEVTVGDPVPAYYKHSKIIISGAVRNITYRLDTIVDCPMEFILPEIEDETHGCWFEMRFRHAGEYSMTLTPPSADVLIATEHTQRETAGFNMIDLHYTVIDGVKLWRFMNTHSTIPTPAT